MHRRLLLPYLILICTPVASAMAAESNTTLFKDLEQRWLHAIETHDTAFLDKLLADDFTDVSVHGELRNKRDAMNLPVAPAAATQQLSDMKVRRYGDAAVITGLNTVTNRRAGWRVQIRFTDVFVQHGGHWQAVSAQETLLPEPAPVNGN